ncbi:peptidylprolyl isomerase [Paenibacillus sp. HWE-109]|uniref:peptidylprolyl isomerase n=1 Tax=Paenibacillus sp. HWE-109 TaxID=1306526 RepID=UPI001EDFBD72|nr:peptidylprolyl isomerase [Paenibacillus sp. HWE-109]UKS26311.1 peptidylprolyl isomerase [Paenibacillus sp. HWE-109]
MKEKLKLLSIGIVIGAMVSTSLGANAAGEKIEVYFKQLKFMFDGNEKEISPAQGKPLVYEGTTYVPLRFMSEALGKTVQYDANRETIWVGDRYSSSPSMSIATNRSYQATIETTKGSFRIELFAKDAPKTVNNFLFLAREGFYDDVTFHRVLKNFVIQAGDPSGTGRGGPGYSFEDELNNGHKYEPGIVAMANSGPNTNGSQFFICTGTDSDYLNTIPNYTIFGKVIEGMDVVLDLASTPVEQNGNQEKSKPIETISIKNVAITEAN